MFYGAAEFSFGGFCCQASQNGSWGLKQVAKIFCCERLSASMARSLPETSGQKNIDSDNIDQIAFQPIFFYFFLASAFGSMVRSLHVV